MTETYDPAKTGSVLIDIADWRKAEEAKIAERGIPFGTAMKLKDGLDPEMHTAAITAVMQTVLNPTWANTLTAGALTVISSTNEDHLRKALVQLASLTVAWIETLDERKAIANG